MENSKSTLIRTKSENSEFLAKGYTLSCGVFVTLLEKKSFFLLNFFHLAKTGAVKLKSELGLGKSWKQSSEFPQ